MNDRASPEKNCEPPSVYRPHECGCAVPDPKGALLDGVGICRRCDGVVWW